MPRIVLLRIFYFRVFISYNPEGSKKVIQIANMVIEKNYCE